MASPFAYFRKNQRTWMAALVIIAIISFVILPNFDSFFGSSPNAPREDREVVVSWKGGSLNREQLQKIRQVHGQMYQIFQRLADEVMKSGGIPRVPGFFVGPQGNTQIGITPPEDVQSSLNGRMMAEAARKRGINVDDETVKQFIRNFCDNRISDKRLKEIIRETAGESLTDHDMKNFLRDEITKFIFIQTGVAGITANQQPLIPPSKNLVNYQKFQQRAKIEAYPVFVDQFIAKVTANPSEQELRLLYDQAKDRFPVPNRPEPGFRQRYQANIEYVSAEFPNFLKQEIEKITEDVLKAAYDKKVAEGAYVVPVEEAKPTEPEKDATKPDEAQDKKPADSSNAENKPAEDNDKKDKEPSTQADKKTDTPKKKSNTKTEKKSAKDSEKSKSENAKDDPKPSDTKEQPKPLDTKEEPKPSDTKEEPKPTDTKDEPKSSDTKDASDPKSSLVSPRNAVRLVAFQDEKEKADQAATDSAKSSSTTTEASVTVTPDPKKPDEKPTRVQTLDEVRQQLLEELASKPARDRMNAALSQVQEAMDTYYNQLQMFQSVEPKDSKKEKPAPPALPSLAAGLGLSYGKTGTVDAISVESLPIGRSMTFVQQFVPIEFSRLAMDKRLRPFQSGRSEARLADSFQTFVYWKIEENDSRTLAYDEVREQVLIQWKLGEARKLAVKAAEEMAGSINASQEENPWSRLLEPSLQTSVERPPAFTWLQPVMTGNEGIQLGMVQGINDPGPTFMEKVFTTPVGKATVALDAAQQKCFVIRVVERTPKDDELLTEFQSAPLTRGPLSLGYEQANQTVVQWFESLARDIGLDASKLPANLMEE